MQFCIKCGNQLPEGALFCNKCGTKAVDAAAETAPAEPVKKEITPSYAPRTDERPAEPVKKEITPSYAPREDERPAEPVKKEITPSYAPRTEPGVQPSSSYAAPGYGTPQQSYPQRPYAGAPGYSSAPASYAQPAYGQRFERGKILKQSYASYAGIDYAKKAVVSAWLMIAMGVVVLILFSLMLAGKSKYEIQYDSSLKMLSGLRTFLLIALGILCIPTVLLPHIGYAFAKQRFLSAYENCLYGESSVTPSSLGGKRVEILYSDIADVSIGYAGKAGSVLRVSARDSTHTINQYGFWIRDCDEMCKIIRHQMEMNR